MSEPAWSWERLAELAPDGPTLERARGIYFSRRWTVLGGDGDWLWGEYALPPTDRRFRVAVRLDPPFFHCNCRSPLRPCKHTLGLLLFLLRADERLRPAQRPDWVRDLEREPSFQPRERDAAADDRRGQRLELMAEGMSELQRFLSDWARRGIAAMEGQQEALESFAARMVDCKLGSVARRLRAMAARIGEENWAEQLLEEMASLYQLSRAWARHPLLPADRRLELAVQAGLSLRREEVLAEKPADGHWLVMGVRSGEEENLRFRRVWLREENSGRWALLLDFAFGNQPFEQQWPIGAAFTGAVYYYPSPSPQRAIFPRPVPSRRAYDLSTHGESFTDSAGHYAAALRQQPWLSHWPLLLAEARPLQTAAGTFLLAEGRQLIPCLPLADAYWTLLAESGGRTLTVFGEWDGRRLRPLSFIGGGRLRAL